ncbi:MAG: thioredoxin-disulfide reductase [Rhabdochlamydiaceae bacterium]|nr:thioredoxin-disulfide reductase [Rhabdochlamydiaceae bacterium]
MSTRKVVIIGSGPAAYTAAIYAARADLFPVVFEGFYSGPSGGQLMTTTEVENYPGFPDGVMGPDLMLHFKKQAERFGTICLAEDVKSVTFGERPFTVQGTKTTFQTHSVIIATGATAKRLEIAGAGDGEFWQKGVTACAICDGAAPIFRGKDLYVIGGGDSAIEEAIFLTKFASKVYIVHRRNTFRASRIMADRALSHPKIEVIWDHEIVKIEGDQIVRSVIIENVQTKQQKSCVAAGVFFAIGHRPNTDFLGGQIALEPNGYIKVRPGSSETSLEGVFAAGDVQDHVYRQAITAAGSGCMAALDAERWLSNMGISS